MRQLFQPICRRRGQKLLDGLIARDAIYFGGRLCLFPNDGPLKLAFLVRSLSGNRFSVLKAELSVVRTVGYCLDPAVEPLNFCTKSLLCRHHGTGNFISDLLGQFFWQARDSWFYETTVLLALWVKFDCDSNR